MDIIAGLTLDVAVWFDLSIAADAGGAGATVEDCQIVTLEL
jgi:hypothetical protein